MYSGVCVFYYCFNETSLIMHIYTLRVFFFKKKPRLRKIEARSNDVG